MTAFRMYLRVVSSTLSAADITSRLGVSPDAAEEKGSRRRPQSPPFADSRWMRYARTSRDDARPEDLEPVVLSWGMDFANRVGRLVRDEGAFVSLEIVQEIRDIDNVQERGIFLSPALCAWLAAAQATLDIDQYIFHDCAEHSVDATGASG